MVPCFVFFHLALLCFVLLCFSWFSCSEWWWFDVCFVPFCFVCFGFALLCFALHSFALFWFVCLFVCLICMAFSGVLYSARVESTFFCCTGKLNWILNSFVEYFAYVGGTVYRGITCREPSKYQICTYAHVHACMRAHTHPHTE